MADPVLKFPPEPKGTPPAGRAEKTAAEPRRRRWPACGVPPLFAVGRAAAGRR